MIKAGIEIVGYLSYAKKEDAEDENEAKAKIAALTIVLTQLAASEEKRMDEEKKNSDIHENVQKTSEYIQKINDITKQLDKIEKNQKILALNASIEAARAGEAGKDSQLLQPMYLHWQQTLVITTAKSKMNYRS